MIILAQIYLIILTFLLGSRDGLNYSIFWKPTGNYQTIQKKLKQWHIMGSLIYFIGMLPVLFYVNWLLIIPALLIRLSIYDICYNKFAGMPIGHIGTEAFWDKLFVKFFGPNSAVKKALVVGGITILLNILYFTL